MSPRAREQRRKSVAIGPAQASTRIKVPNQALIDDIRLAKAQDESGGMET
jgi:hypothetical protein